MWGALRRRCHRRLLLVHFGGIGACRQGDGGGFRFRIGLSMSYEFAKRHRMYVRILHSTCAGVRDDDWARRPSWRPADPVAVRQGRARATRETI
jgi:hypothetical protein